MAASIVVSFEFLSDAELAILNREPPPLHSVLPSSTTRMFHMDRAKQIHAIRIVQVQGHA